MDFESERSIDTFWVEGYFRERAWQEKKSVGTGNDKASLEKWLVSSLS